MPRSRIVLAVGLIALAVMIGVVALGGWFDVAPAPVRPVPAGGQEIAWIAPATSGESWERLVAALKLLQRDWPKLHGGAALELGLERAFLAMTADVPEISLGLAGAGKLWIRWYKVSGENDGPQWIATLAKRFPASLAIIGGDTTDRALTFAEALAEARTSWRGSPPLFCITTATAERYSPRNGAAAGIAHDEWPKLMSAYPGMSFRFSFTNSRMVEAALDFVRDTPQVWLLKQSQPGTCAAAVAAGNAWGSLAVLAAAGHLQPYYLYTLAWGDDTYSKDLAEIFSRQFNEQFHDGGKEITNVTDGPIPYGIGDYFQANPRELLAVDLFLVNRAALGDEQHLLVLPTGAQRTRRFLRTLCRRAPTETRNLVVVNGDAISFNNVYRDRDVAWNILDIPVPLVFFSHRNPIDKAAGFDPIHSATGTQDLLLYRDIIEALLEAAHEEGRLLGDAHAVKARLECLRWRDGRIAGGAEPGGLAFFDAEGNRAAGTGEHIVWLQPAFEGTRGRILPEASLTVWHVFAEGWRLTDEPLEVRYNRSAAEVGGGR